MLEINNLSGPREQEPQGIVAGRCATFGTIKRLKIYPANGTLARPFAQVDMEIEPPVLTGRGT